MQAVQGPVQMDIETPSHIPGPLNGNPYATVNQAMKMKCRAAEEENHRDYDYPGETKMAKYNGNNNNNNNDDKSSNLVFQFPVAIGERQVKEEQRKEAMDELLDSLGIEGDGVKTITRTDREVTMTITTSSTTENKRQPKPPQRQDSFKATKRINAALLSAQTAVNEAERPKVQTTPPDAKEQHVYYASHYAASQPGKVKAKLFVDSNSTGQLSPTASPELIANRKLLLDVIDGGGESEEESPSPPPPLPPLPSAAEVVVVESTKDNHESDSDSEEEINFHESPTLPRRGNVAEKVQFLSKSIAFSPQEESPEIKRCKKTMMPMIGLTHLAPTEVSDRIAKHNEKSLAAGQVMGTENLVLYSSKQPPKKVVENNPDSRHSDEEPEIEDFTAVSLRHIEKKEDGGIEMTVGHSLRHTEPAWNELKENQQDDDEIDHADFPPPPPLDMMEQEPPPAEPSSVDPTPVTTTLVVDPTPVTTAPISSELVVTPVVAPAPVAVATMKIGAPVKFKLNLQVAESEKIISPTYSEGHAFDSGVEDSAISPVGSPQQGTISEAPIQKLSVQLEENVSQELLDELFAEKPRTNPDKQALDKPEISIVVDRPESQARRDAEDDAAGYSRIEDIEPGKGTQDTEMKDTTQRNGMTDEEFLNSYTIVDEKAAGSQQAKSESMKQDLANNNIPPTSPIRKTKQSAAERAPAVLNELINGIRTMKQEMSHKAKSQSMDNDVFPTSPSSDKSSPTGQLSPTSTLSSRGKRRRRKASDRGYGSTNSSLSETELFVEIPKNPSVKFDKDTSAFWYKPHITREQAIALLQDKTPGTFVIRDSQSYTGAFGLAIKVEVPPMHVIQNQQNKDFDNIDPSEFVRHLLIESTPKGVHLKDCKDEPLFGSLAAFVYQHSLTEISLPCKLILPTKDLTVGTLKITDRQETEAQLLTNGAACNVAYLGTFNVESLTGSAAFQYAVAKIEPGRKNKEHEPVLVNFKINKQGITLTDNDRKWDLTEYGGGNMARSFVFVSRKTDCGGNECHLFAEMDVKQPAATVVDVITKIMSNVNS